MEDPLSFTVDDNQLLVTFVSYPSVDNNNKRGFKMTFKQDVYVDRGLTTQSNRYS